MIDLSPIKNKKLRDLIYLSAKFNTMSDERQKTHVEQIKSISPDGQEQLCRFFEIENAKEKPINSEARLVVLERLYNELLDLEAKFTRLLRQETESKDREKEDKEIETLLNELNK